MWFYYLILLALGLCVGSFINVLLYRLDREGGIIAGRSKCRDCAAQLKWYDLIPVLSYIFLRARCRHCRKRISIIYPIIELVTALVFLILIQNSQFTVYGLRSLIISSYFLILASSFIALFFFDYLYLVLPDKITFPMIVLTAIYDTIFKRGELPGSILTALTLAGFFAIIYVVSRGQWMGFGDVKLILLIGLLFGFPNAVLVFVFSTWLAAAFGLALVALKKANLKTALPFGSFLSAVSILFLIFENELAFLSQIF